MPDLAWHIVRDSLTPAHGYMRLRDTGVTNGDLFRPHGHAHNCHLIGWDDRIALGAIRVRPGVACGVGPDGGQCGEVRVVGAPTGPGVYYLLTPTRRLSYVGKAANLRRRLGDHARDPRWTRIADVRWELVGTEAAAIAREADVIVALQPARNRAIRRDEYYSYVTIGPRGRLLLGRHGDYGCFPHLGRGAYSAPGRACIDGFTALGHVIQATRPEHDLVHDFLSGTSDRLLHIDHDNEQPHVRFGLERDRRTAKAFFDAGPRAMRDLRDRHGGTGLVTREDFVSWIRTEIDELLR